MLNIIWNFIERNQTKLVGPQETKDVFSDKMQCFRIE